MTRDEIKRFRQLGSKTPGHPEMTHAPSGVETTTGPLGQGIGNAVGMAVSAKMAEARFNTKDHEIFDHHIVVLAGDGCMQEGVAMEAVEFAGHQKLDNLILIYDSNAVTLDAMAKVSQSENTAARFEAIGSMSSPSTATTWMRSSTHLRPREGVWFSGKPQAHHRQDAHRQGHSRGAGHPEGARRGRREVRGRGAQGPRPAGGAFTTCSRR